MTDVTNPTGETPAAPVQSAAASDVTAETSAQQPAQTTEEVFDQERAMRTIKAQRAEAAELKKQLKELETLKAEKAKREEAELTEAQRLQKQAEEYKAQAAKLQADIWRRDAITEAGLPSSLADRVQGATYDELLADAKKLAELLPKKPTAPNINATNPGNPGTETDAQKRQRLFGTNADPFAGGGVVWNEKKQ